MEDSIPVERQIENDRVARRRLAETFDAELADLDVLQRIDVLPLVNPDIDGRLVVEHREEDLALANRDRRVLRNYRDIMVRIEFAIQLVQRTGAEGVGGYIDENRRHLGSGDGGPLDGGTHGNAEVGIDLAPRLLAEHLPQTRADQGGSRGPTDQKDFIHLRRGEVRRFECDVDRSQKSLR